MTGWPAHDHCFYLNLLVNQLAEAMIIHVTEIVTVITQLGDDVRRSVRKLFYAILLRNMSGTNENLLWKP